MRFTPRRRIRRAGDVRVAVAVGDCENDIAVTARRRDPECARHASAYLRIETDDTTRGAPRGTQRAGILGGGRLLSPNAGTERFAEWRAGRRIGRHTLKKKLEFEL